MSVFLVPGCDVSVFMMRCCMLVTSQMEQWCHFLAPCSTCRECVMHLQRKSWSVFMKTQRKLIVCDTFHVSVFLKLFLAANRRLAPRSVSAAVGSFSLVVSELPVCKLSETSVVPPEERNADGLQQTRCGCTSCQACSHKDATDGCNWVQTQGTRTWVFFFLLLQHIWEETGRFCSIRPTDLQDETSVCKMKKLHLKLKKICCQVWQFVWNFDCFLLITAEVKSLWSWRRRQNLALDE